MVARVRVRGLMVVETNDALLICRRGESRKVREITDLLEERSLKTYLKWRR